MQRTVHTWSGFRHAWDGDHNFLMDGECLPFAFDLPPMEDVVDMVRQDPDARISSGAKGDRLNLESMAEQFRAMPLHEAMQQPFALAHFKLDHFYGKGQFLEGFEQRVLDPWRDALKAQGFTWDRCYPIIFISGIGCATNYHMDFSHVVAWQIHGHKRFCGLRDPDRWAPRELRVNYEPATFSRPTDLTDADALCYDMPPGAVLWNALLTPHWVEAGDQVAMSINLSHGGLRLNGKLARNEQELSEHRTNQQKQA